MQVSRTSRLLMLLTALLLAVVWRVGLPSVHGGQDTVSVYKQSATAERTADEATATPTDYHHPEATLTDASQLYRICSTRPQRVSPTHGSPTKRSPGPSGGTLRRHHVKPLYSVYDSRRRRETAPFCPAVSRDYYVIALRHIIR